MTLAATLISGDLLTADVEQRHAALAAACQGEVRLLTDSPELRRRLAARGDVALVDEFQDADATLLASSDDAPLADDLVTALLAHAGRGGTVIVDTIAGDPVERDLERLLNDRLTVLLQTRAACAVLTTGDAVLGEQRLVFPGDAVARSHADRVLLFSGRAAEAGAAALAQPTSAVLTAVPTGTEVAALRRAVAQLEQANRRLAEGRLGVHDAAAGRAVTASAELRAARERIVALEDELEHAKFHAKQNDELFQGARLELFETAAHAERLEAHLQAHQVRPRAWARWQLARISRRLRGR